MNEVGPGLDARYGEDLAVVSHRPVFDLPKRSQYMARHMANDKKPYVEYYDYLAKLVRDWGILDFINDPGAGVNEYVKRRRLMPEIAMLGRIARVATEKPVTIPQQYDWYPIPTLIYKNQGIGKDWLIDKETGDVLVYALENTNINPLEDPKCKNMPRETMSETIRQRTVYINFPEGATGIGRLELGPGCAIALPLCADPWLPRKSMPCNPEGTGAPSTRLVAYDPTNPKHNRALRGEVGVGTDARLFVFPDEDDEKVETNVKKG
jgi:hypothetical protein